MTFLLQSVLNCSAQLPEQAEVRLMLSLWLIHMQSDGSEQTVFNL